jgi:hypothetical protein
VNLAQSEPSKFAARLIVKQTSHYGSHLGQIEQQIFLKQPDHCPNGGLRKIRKKSGLQRELFTWDERNKHDAQQTAI